MPTRRPRTHTCLQRTQCAHALPRGLQGGCIIRAGFLDRIKQAYQRDPALPSLLVDPAFAQVCAAVCARVVCLHAWSAVSACVA